jgi:hypothetical protein
MITVGRNAILGSYSLEIVFLSLGAFARHFRRKLLKVLTVSGPGNLPAGEFTVYKKSRPDHLCPDPTENLILFNQLPAQGT